MIRVAWFLTDLRVGGAETLPLTLLPLLREADSVLVLLKDRIERQVPSGLEVLALGPESRRLRSGWSTVLPAAVRASRGADVLVGGMEGAPLIVAALAGLWTGKPVVGVVPTHLGRYHAAQRFGALEWRLLRWALARCRVVITASEDARAALLELGLAHDRTRVIPNPVSPWAVRVRRESCGDGATTHLLTVGRLEPVKGMDLILEAARQMQDTAFLWKVAGRGPEEAALRRQAVDLGIDERVRFLGFVDDLQPLLACADVFVLTSRVEGLPIAMLEAMAAGIAVTATRSGRGVEEALDGGRAGVLVPPDDPQALARALRELIADPARRRALGEAGRRRSRDYRAEAIAARYREALEAAR